jgi:hypothetical protein
MASGGTIGAHIVDKPSVLYGERPTGEEAFIPKYGDRSRSLGVLQQAAGWLGAQVTAGGQQQAYRGPAVSSSGGGERVIRVIVQDTNGRVLRQELIRDAVGRGVPQTTIRTAFP